MDLLSNGPRVTLLGDVRKKTTSKGKVTKTLTAASTHGLTSDAKQGTHSLKMALIYEKVINVISLDPSQRQDSHVQPLLPWFEKKSDIFRSLEKDTLKDIIRNCQFLSCDENDVIIKQGEKGDCFYVLLRGSVNVYINNALSDADDPAEVAADKADDNELSFFSKNGLRKAADKAKFGNYIAQIPAGKSFGELALISKDCIRNASIIADGSCDLLVVNRDLYDRSIRSAQEKDFNERRQFIDSCPLFCKWPVKYKRQMAMSLRKEKLNFETHIIKQGDAVSALYFIHRGQGKVVMDPGLHLSQFPHLFEGHPHENTGNQQDFHHEAGGVVRAPKMTPDNDRPPSSRSMTKRRSASSDKYSQLKTFKRAREICLIGSPDVVGDIEVVSGIDTYIETVVCSQSSEVFVLDTRNFERLVVKKVSKTLDIMKECVKLKLESRIARVHDEIPLLPRIFNKLCGNVPDLNTWLHEKPETVGKRSSDQLVAIRGPLIDQYAPGTLFHRIRERGKGKDSRQSKERSPRSVPSVRHLKSRLEAPSSGTGALEQYQATYYDSNSPKTPSSSENSDYRMSPATMSDMSDLEARILAWHMNVASMKERKNSMLDDHRGDVGANLQGSQTLYGPRAHASVSFSSDVHKSTSESDGTHSFRSVEGATVSGQVPSQPQEPANVLPRQYTLDEYKELKLLLKRRSSHMHILPPIANGRKQSIGDGRRSSVTER